MDEMPSEKDRNDAPAYSKGAQNETPITARKLEQNPAVSNSNEEQRRKKPEIYKPAWIQAIATVVIVFITGFYTYYARQSSDASIKAAKAAKDSADAANRAATITENAFNLNREYASNTLTEMQRQSNAMQDAAGAAKTQAGTSIISANAAKSAAKTARDALIRVQRPWVGLDGSPIIETTRDWYSYSARLKNFGIAPALKVGVSIRRPTTDDFQKEMDKTCEEAKVHPFTYIMPGQPYPYRTPHSFYLGGDNSFKLVGCVTYFGQFGDQDFHRTPFCFTSGAPISKTTAESLAACAIKYDIY